MGWQSSTYEYCASPPATEWIETRYPAMDMLPVEELLHELKSELDRIRRLPVGSYPHDFPRPSLASLPGILKASVLDQMGKPDFSLTTAGCEKIGYFFFVASPEMRGGGGVAIEMDVDGDCIVTAKWQLQR